MKTILVTGGAGFIGSNFIRHIFQSRQEVQIVNVDLLTYAGNLENLKEVENHPRYHFVQADIGDRKAMEKVFEIYEITHVINFAAESHVDRSIEEPEVFLTTNIIGTQVLLDVAKRNWKLFPQDKYSKVYKPGVKFLQVSTDEVYGALSADGKFTETSPVLPNSPYSASKASGDLIVRSYHETYGLPVNITRCGNNYGPYQFPEKLIPLMIQNALQGKKLPVYGDGLQIRDWIHVKDHCRALETVLEKGEVGEIYNVGGDNEIANIEVVQKIIEVVGKDESLIEYVKDRPGHDRRYAIDNRKITKELGWLPSYTFEEGLKETIQWYLDNIEWIQNITCGAYEEYYQKMYGEEK
ncbi:MAG TPA: dTDP-glucose 4,6-dehydratase [Eubacteriaceae bacterium]|nr:dTDP-glucose 4,6-dehydratase [Eubacteriaceae bacterium]